MCFTHKLLFSIIGSCLIFFFFNYTCLLENIHVDIKTLTQRERERERERFNLRKDFWLNFLLVINKT